MGNYHKYKDFEKSGLIGKQFGKLKILKGLGYRQLNNGKRRTYVLCECQCESKTLVEVQLDQLLYGHIRSCGCMRKGINRIHGKTGSRLYKIYYGMVRRCNNPDSKYYQRYGGRGIYICDEWLEKGKGNPGFMNFYNWAMENGYDKSLTLDRIDNDGPYAPWNCRWADTYIQADNKRNNSYIWDGEELLTYAEFGRKYGVEEYYVTMKITHGWSFDAIVYAAKHQDLKITKSSRVQQESKGFVYYRDKDKFMHLIPKLPKMPDELLRKVKQHQQYHVDKGKCWYYVD